MIIIDGKQKSNDSFFTYKYVGFWFCRTIASKAFDGNDSKRWSNCDMLPVITRDMMPNWMAWENLSKHICMRSSVFGSIFCIRYRSAWLHIESTIVPRVIAFIVVGVELFWDACWGEIFGKKKQKLIKLQRINIFGVCNYRQNFQSTFYWIFYSLVLDFVGQPNEVYCR